MDKLYKALLVVAFVLPVVALVAVVISFMDDDAPGEDSPSHTYVENAGCGLNMKMVLVEGGTFQMGATSEQSDEAEHDEWPVHEVILTPYYIAECEVTQSQWEAVMGTDIYDQLRVANGDGVSSVGDKQPMYFVNWYDAKEFCNKLSRMTGKLYVLPTEAQWEYAARGGKYSRGYKYSGSNYVDEAVWCRGNSSATRIVKSKAPNELGLYDMSGNVYEWCNDWYGAYSSEKQNNPEGASYSDTRILRGGSWFSKASSCRLANRYFYDPYRRNGNFGFRVVCIP